MATDMSRYGVVVPAPKGYKPERRPRPQAAQGGVSFGKLLAKAGIRPSMFKAA
jgi:hypothetical protein